MNSLGSSPPASSTLLWIKVKIGCFLLLYALIAMLLVSFVSGGVAEAFTVLDRESWAMAFGLYLAMAGASTMAISSWRAEVELRSASTGHLSQQRTKALRRSKQLGHVVAGTAFVVLGLAFLGSGVGRLLGWWPAHELFGSTAGRIALLVLVNMPMIIGSAVMTVTASRDGAA